MNSQVHVNLPLAFSLAAFAIFLGGPFVARMTSGPKGGALRISQFGALASLAALAVAILALTRGPTLAASSAAVVAAIAPLLMIAPVVSVSVRKIPSINDVATDVDDPPEFVHAKSIPENASRSLEFPAANREIVRASYPDLKPVFLSGNVDDVFDRARRTAQSMPGWAIAAADPKLRTIEASEETSVFHFVDDVVIRVRADANGSRVDVRSKSREARGDRGANAARIRAYLARLSAPL